jgi:hypothetical protein
VLGFGGLVAGEGAAVGTEVVGLVEFPGLVAEGVLEGVAALLAEATQVGGVLGLVVLAGEHDRVGVLAGRQDVTHGLSSTSTS